MKEKCPTCGTDSTSVDRGLIETLSQMRQITASRGVELGERTPEHKAVSFYCGYTVAMTEVIEQLLEKRTPEHQSVERPLEIMEQYLEQIVKPGLETAKTEDDELRSMNFYNGQKQAYEHCIGLIKRTPDTSTVGQFRDALARLVGDLESAANIKCEPINPDWTSFNQAKALLENRTTDAPTVKRSVMAELYKSKYLDACKDFHRLRNAALALLDNVGDGDNGPPQWCSAEFGALEDVVRETGPQCATDSSPGVRDE